MLFAHEPLKRDLRSARRVLWWSFALEICSVLLPGLGLSSGVYALMLSAFSVTLLLFAYILFLGFSRLAKNFHAMPLFWLFVAQILFSVFFRVIDVIEKLASYGVRDPYAGVASGITLLTGATLTFLYGYYIMRLPEKKFGTLLLSARVANIGKALLMSALVYCGALEADSLSMTALYGLVLLGSLLMIVVCNAIDYMILGKALSIVGGVLPHPAPKPR